MLVTLLLDGLDALDKAIPIFLLLFALYLVSLLVPAVLLFSLLFRNDKSRNKIKWVYLLSVVPLGAAILLPDTTDKLGSLFPWLIPHLVFILLVLLAQWFQRLD